MVCLFLGLLVLEGTGLYAQDEAARIATEQDVIRRRPEESRREGLEFRITDPDLGEINLVSRTPKPKTFTFSTTQNFLYTSNAFLVPNNDRSTIFWNGRFDASVVPYSTRNFTPRLTFEQNFFRYDNFSQLDFDSHSLQAEVKYDLNRDDSWFVIASYAGARLYTPRGDIDEFYKYGLAHASISHSRQLGQSPVYFAGTLGSNYRHGDPSAFDRVTAFLNAAFLYSPLEYLQLTAYIRPEGQFYTNDPLDDSRTDFNLSLGFAASVTPIEYFSVGLTASFVGNYSSSDPADYDVFSPSIVLAGRVAF
jgi:hypothetical protein